MWKSRIDKLPPAQFFADLVAHLEAAFPGARMDRQTLEQLYPFFVEEWRSGQSAHDTAKATCACDGKNIVPSMATNIVIPRRSVRPPAGAQRGQLVTPEELRDPAPLHSARVALEVAKRDVEHLEAEQARLISDLNHATKERQRTKIEGQIAKVNSALNEAAHRLTTAQARVTQAEEQAPYKRATTIVAPPKASRAARKPPAKKKQAASEGPSKEKRARHRWTPPAAHHHPGGTFSVVVEAIPNKDFAPGTPQASVKVPLATIPVASLAAAKALFQAFVQENGLGAGNLTSKSGRVSRDGKPLALISFNGKLWEVDGRWKQTGKELDDHGHAPGAEKKAPCDDCKKKRGPKKTAPKADAPSSTPTIPNLEELANLFAEADLLDKKG